MALLKSSKEKTEFGNSRIYIVFSRLFIAIR
jgi:hypothetical protein